MAIHKWKQLSSKDVSPSSWFPIESRDYELPDGKIIKDFTVTTLADVSMIIPMTTEGKIVLVNQYKPGVDEVMLQFAAGRKEPGYKDMLETAQHELEEETGIKTPLKNLHYFATLTAFSTKATERVFFYFAPNCSFNSDQKFDETEEIEIVQLTPEELDQKIELGDIICSQTIASWELAKKKFPELHSHSCSCC